MKCHKCNKEGKLRKTPPKTADKSVAKYFDYYDCKQCKCVFAYKKSNTE